MSVRIGIIDSGVNAAHPHVGTIAGGAHVTAEGVEDDFTDVLGHGTAVAGAIREKNPAADIYALRGFARPLVTSGKILLRAIDWCLDAKLDFINLSLGTRNPDYRAAFEAGLARAHTLGTRIVAAYEVNGERILPGALDGVVAVVLDNSIPRDRFETQLKEGRVVYAAAGYPRDIPGVPPQHNLQGISFAVANITGLFAASLVASPCQ